ncbi:hypothetical protein [Psychrobacter sp. GW64-MNA-CIBAN-0177]|uniref:hypothetical protein n=1 Tax=Psychrobacter sp. GW64-MNA-CIBAN-0177 TaxID=3140449 RepID=UPI00331FC472
MSFSVELLLGTLAVIATITVPLIIYFLQKSRKKLSYEIISNTQLVGVENKIKDRITILYDEKKVVNVHLISIRFVNDGNQPISIDDFAMPINVRLGSDTNILTCEVLEQNPNELNAAIVKMEDSVEIQPLLINANDSFKLNILVNNYEGSLFITARIKGIKTISIYKEPKFTIVNFLFVMYFLIGMLGLFSTIYGREANNNVVSDIGYVSFMIFITLSLLSLLSMCIAVMTVIRQRFYRDKSL